LTSIFQDAVIAKSTTIEAREGEP
jgi:hypothetical protein